MKKKDTYTLDKYYNFERPKNYIPSKHVKVENEIKELCNKSRIAVKEIIAYDGYKVYGTKTRSHKDCKELQEAIDTPSHQVG